MPDTEMPEIEQTASIDQLKQRVSEETQKALKGLLEQFPDIRSLALAIDYKTPDCASLPSGVWMPRSSMAIHDILKSCETVDRMSYMIRAQHDSRVLQLLKQVNLNAEHAGKQPAQPLNNQETDKHE